MLSVLNDLVESRIAKAQAAGEFDQLLGMGEPLDLREDPLVPEEVRVANRVMKNAGLVPRELHTLKTVLQLRQSLRTADLDDDSRRRIRRRIAALLISLNADNKQAVGSALAFGPEPAPVTE